jgi:hypothetical protein
MLPCSTNPSNALKFCCSAGPSQDTPTGRRDKGNEAQWRPHQRLSIKANAFAVAASSNFSLNETALAHGSFDSSSIRKLLPAV